MLYEVVVVVVVVIVVVGDAGVEGGLNEGVEKEVAAVVVAVRGGRGEDNGLLTKTDFWRALTTDGVRGLGALADSVVVTVEGTTILLSESCDF